MTDKKGCTEVGQDTSGGARGGISEIHKRVLKIVGGRRETDCSVAVISILDSVRKQKHSGRAC